MKTTRLPKALAAFPFLALVALSGCSGGGVVTDTDPPDQGADPQVEMALERTIAAADAAASSLADAQAACAAAQAACSAAGEAADAAARVQAARRAAEAATTVAEVEREADLAEAAARDAEDAAAEAERLAEANPSDDVAQAPDGVGQTPDDGTDHVYWPEWPINPAAARSMSGGLEIEDTNSEAILAHLDAVFNSKTHYTENNGNTQQWHARNVEFSPVMQSIEGIPLFQARSSDQILTGFITNPGVIAYGGWMDYSYFVLGQLTSDVYHPSLHGPEIIGSIYTGYTGFVSTPSDRNWGNDSFDLDVGMHWRGTMIGVDKALKKPNFVQGSVHMTVRNETGDYNQPAWMDLDLKDVVNLTTGTRYQDLRWNKVDITYGLTFGSSEGQRESTGFWAPFNTTLYGNFSGPNAEEAVGIIERDSLAGVFGAKRHP